MNSFFLEILTPERVAFSDQAEMVTAPSAMGVIGILPRHIPLFTRLVEGEVKIIKGKEEFYLAIGGGFLEVTPQKVSILVTEAHHAHELNQQDILAAKKAAEEALAKKPSGQDFRQAQALFRRSLIALKVLRRRKSSGVRI